MEVQEVEVFIDASGQVRLEVRGVKGPGCLELTAGLEAALGGHIQMRQMTAEAREQASESAETQQAQRGGR